MNEFSRFLVRSSLPGPRLNHAMCSFATIGAIERVRKEDVPGDSEPIAPESTSSMSVPLGS